MDDLNLLHLCIEQMHHSTTQKLLQERCIPWLKEMGMDEKTEARMEKYKKFKAIIEAML